MQFRVLMLGPSRAAIVRRLVEALRDEGIEVLVVSHEPAENEVVDLGQLHSIRDFFRTRRLKQAINAFRPDVIHAHGVNHYGLMASLQRDVPFVAAMWGSDVMLAPHRGHCAKRLFFRLVNRFVMRRASMCHTSGAHVTLEAMRQAGTREGKFRTFYWGIMPNALDEPAEGVRLEREYNLYGKQIVVCPRGLKDIYQPKLLADFIHTYVDIYKDEIQFVVLRGYSEDIDVQKFKERVGDYERHVTVIDRLLSDTELAALYQRSVAHISIPASDSLGGGVVEPAYCGSLPVLSDIPANRQFAEQYGGHIIESGERSALEQAAHIIHACISKDECMHSAVFRIKENFSRKAVISKILSMYEEVNARETSK